jgi:hypothetical protein
LNIANTTNLAIKVYIIEKIELDNNKWNNKHILYAKDIRQNHIDIGSSADQSRSFVS